MTGYFHGYESELIVDTGSGRTLVSRRIYDELSKGGVLPELDTSRSLQVRVANNTVTRTAGCVQAHISFGGISVVGTVGVLDNAPFNVLVGNDFLELFQPDISFSNRKITPSAGEPVSFSTYGLLPQQPIDCLVRSASNFNVPPRSLMVVEGRIYSSHHVENYQGVFLPAAKFEHSTMNLAPTVVAVGKRDRFCLQVLNLSDQTRSIAKDEVLGRFQSGPDLFETMSFWIDDTEAPTAARAPASPSAESSAPLPEGIRLRTPEQADLTPEQWEHIEQLLKKNLDIFGTKSTRLGADSKFTCTIPTTTQVPLKDQRPTRSTPAGHEIIRREVERLIAAGIIRPSSSPWAAPVVIVRKKDGEPRFCIDYRYLNSVTVKDTYPLPLISEMMMTLGKAQYFSALDLMSGYHQLGVAEQDIYKTAFATRDGTFEFVKMPFGLQNAPAIFQRVMNQVLSGLTWRYCLVYLDDILIFSESFDEHMMHLQAVFDRLRAANLFLTAKKCTFFAKQLKYLGHILSPQGVATDPEKTSVIQNMPSCRDVDDVRSFLGLTGYYRRFVYNYAKIALPLTELLRKDAPFEWTPRREAAQRELCEKLVSAPILTHPNFSKPFRLDTDSSGHTIGAVLSQPTADGPGVIAYWSRAMTPAECNYHPAEYELLAIVEAIQFFRAYLEMQRFAVFTDHRGLQDLFKKTDIKGRLARWVLKLLPYDFTVQYRPGASNANADGVTRGPVARYVKSLQTPGPESELQRAKVDAVAARFNAEPAPVLLVQEESSPVEASPLDHLRPQALQKAQKDDKSLRDFMRLAHKLDGDSRNPFSFKNGLLIRKTFVGTELRDLVVVPFSLRDDVLKALHDEPTAGHMGVDRTYLAVRSRFWWPNMVESVEHWVRTCLSCQAKKTPVRPTQGQLQHVVATRPWEVVSMDIVGPFHSTKSGNQWIFTLMDVHSGYPFAFPIKNHKASTLAHILLTYVIPLIGCGSKFTSDRGSDFLSRIFRDLFAFLDSLRVTTSGYHPQANPVERFHNPLVRILSHFINDRHSDWDELIPFALLAYRGSYHSTFPYTPSEVAFNHSLKMPIDAIAAEDQEVRLHVPKTLLVEQALEHWTNVVAVVNYYRQISRDANKLRYDRNAQLVIYRIGQLVWLYVPAIKKTLTKKLAKLWRGPFRIVGQTSPVNYVLLVPRRGRELRQVVHVQRLKPFFSRYEEPIAQPTIIDEHDNFDPDIEDLDVLAPELEATETGPQNGHLQASTGLNRVEPRLPASPQTGLDVPATQTPATLAQTQPLGSTPDMSPQERDSSEAVPFVPLPFANPLEVDDSYLKDLYAALSNLYTHVHDNGFYRVSAAKSQLKNLLGEGTLFIKSTSLQRALQKEIRAIKNREQLLKFLQGCTERFIVKFAAELDRLSTARQLRASRRRESQDS